MSSSLKRSLNLRWTYRDGWYLLEGLEELALSLRVSTKLTDKSQLEELLKGSVGLDQVHSSTLKFLTPGEKLTLGKWGYLVPLEKPEGDAILSLRPLKWNLVVRTADCYPIAILDLGKRAAGLVHAGWRGSLRGVLQVALEQFVSLGIPAEDLVLAFGPGICGSCYQVGDEVIEAFKVYNFWREFIMDENRLDLFKFNLMLARQFGVRIVVPPPACTLEDEKLPSYRRGDRGERAFTILSELKSL